MNGVWKMVSSVGIWTNDLSEVFMSTLITRPRVFSKQYKFSFYSFVYFNFYFIYHHSLFLLANYGLQFNLLINDKFHLILLKHHISNQKLLIQTCTFQGLSFYVCLWNHFITIITISKDAFRVEMEVIVDQLVSNELRRQPNEGIKRLRLLKRFVRMTLLFKCSSISLQTIPSYAIAPKIKML